MAAKKKARKAPAPRGFMAPVPQGMPKRKLLTSDIQYKLDPDLELLLKAKPNMNHDNNENLGERYSAFYEQVLGSAK